MSRGVEALSSAIVDASSRREADASFARAVVASHNEGLLSADEALELLVSVVRHG